MKDNSVMALCAVTMTMKILLERCNHGNYNQMCMELYTYFEEIYHCLESSDPNIVLENCFDDVAEMIKHGSKMYDQKSNVSNSNAFYIPVIK